MPSQATFQAVFDVSANQDWIVKHLHSAYKQRRRRPRRQRERQKSKLYHAFVHLLPSPRDHNVKTPNFTSCEGHEGEDISDRLFFFLNFNKSL